MLFSREGERRQLWFSPAFSIPLDTAQPHGQTAPWCPLKHQPLCAWWESQLAQPEHQPQRGSRPRRRGYSLQNFWKSACSSLRALRKSRPFSVPSTKALSSWTAMQATSAFSLESAEHCGEAPGQSGCGGSPCSFPVGFFSFPSKDSPIEVMFWSGSEFHGVYDMS